MPGEEAHSVKKHGSLPSDHGKRTDKKHNRSCHIENPVNHFLYFLRRKKAQCDQSLRQRYHDMRDHACKEQKLSQDQKHDETRIPALRAALHQREGVQVQDEKRKDQGRADPLQDRPHVFPRIQIHPGPIRLQKHACHTAYGVKTDQYDKRDGHDVFQLRIVIHRQIAKNAVSDMQEQKKD